MKHEAKFSVIMPSSQFSTAQIETFEQTVHRYGLPVQLPLRSDGNGNLLVSSGLSLRDAQSLRRQISGLGFPVDVINDTSENTRVSGDISSDTVVVDIPDIDYGTLDPVSDITADTLSSLEMPSLDLGLFDNNDAESIRRKEIEQDTEEETERTLSLSALDLFKAAHVTDGEAAPGSPKAASPKMQLPASSSSAHNAKIQRSPLKTSPEHSIKEETPSYSTVAQSKDKDDEACVSNALSSKARDSLKTEQLDSGAFLSVLNASSSESASQEPDAKPIESEKHTEPDDAVLKASTESSSDDKNNLDKTKSCEVKSRIAGDLDSAPSASCAPKEPSPSQDSLSSARVPRESEVDSARTHGKHAFLGLFLGIILLLLVLTLIQAAGVSIPFVDFLNARLF